MLILFYEENNEVIVKYQYIKYHLDGLIMYHLDDADS